MNALFGSLTTEGLEEAKDRIGGYQPFETDIYTGNIKLAYAGQSSGGARNVTLVVDIDGREYSETVYVTSKDGKNWFTNKSDPSKKVPLPGFTVIDDICLVTTGEPLNKQATEEKVVKIYDYEARTDVPTSVHVLVGLIGQTVSLGIVKTLENKSKKGDNGEYVDIADTREVNHIDKVWHTETKKTVAEARSGAEEAVFWGSWSDRNKGNTRDKRTIKDGEGGASGNSGRPRASNSNTPPTPGAGSTRKSLFG